GNLQLKNQPRPWLAPLVFFLLTAAYIGVLLPFPPGIYDEGLIVCGAERILRGQHTYVDFMSGYPPGQFYTIALVFRVFGTGLLAERIWDSVWRLAMVAAAAWLTRALTRKDFKVLPLAFSAALARAIPYRRYPV